MATRRRSTGQVARPWRRRIAPARQEHRRPQAKQALQMWWRQSSCLSRSVVRQSLTPAFPQRPAKQTAPSRFSPPNHCVPRPSSFFLGGQLPFRNIVSRYFPCRHLRFRPSLHTRAWCYLGWICSAGCDSLHFHFSHASNHRDRPTPVRSLARSTHPLSFAPRRSSSTQSSRQGCETPSAACINDRRRTIQALRSRIEDSVTVAEKKAVDR